MWHGLGKLVGAPFAGGGIEGTIGFFASVGIPMPAVMAWVVALVEAVGGLALILGVAVPVFAAALAINMAVALLTVHLSKGFSVSGGGYEFVLTLLAGSVCLCFAGPGVLAVQLKPKNN
jgi:putative oxidoreductase